MQSPMAITTEMSQQIDFSNVQGEKSSFYEVCKLRYRHLKDVQRGRRYRKLQSRIPSYRSPSGRRKPLEIILESCDVTLRIETRRISFNDQLQTTTTYSKNVYDRSPIATAHTENQSLHLYMDLVCFKLTEMKLHMDSVNSINLHMANTDPQDLNIRKQIIHDILAANWGSSDLY
ncbi:hypothetical protein SARC_04093 [Sphaeroforma arctica JP610]|uniref:Uncharacterized protein n=1 Tax=Sphaeroforma arctica JP610 TaxID=667725 RepID=A0A0L0G3N5_9EUKA|nr:hypothetical protein SARC_04093 [Sphaeroforma arctica JP610]KNC83660.1 hypothetical protein SARC_04093 [Sphaeroforma arctica JP610]|eukprot:XP_014157562.1 hypothetical protein SARC_04093 [Sphaeroforma arctica JP610]